MCNIYLFQIFWIHIIILANGLRLFLKLIGEIIQEIYVVLLVTSGILFNQIYKHKNNHSMWF